MNPYGINNCVLRPGEYCPMEPAGKWCFNCGHSPEGIDKSLKDYKEWEKKHPLPPPSLLLWMAEPKKPESDDRKEGE